MLTIKVLKLKRSKVVGGRRSRALFAFFSVGSSSSPSSFFGLAAGLAAATGATFFSSTLI
jgi:hypothetical protein